MNKEKGIIWDCTRLAVMWSIWNKRNSVIFEGVTLDCDEITEAKKIRIALWVKTKEGGCGAEYSIDVYLLYHTAVL